jgi:parallel beta-helix repeat protein
VPSHRLDWGKCDRAWYRLNQIFSDKFLTASFMVQSPTTNQLYVNPATGRDDNAGNAGAPLRTIGAALRLAQAGTTIQLAPGTYASASGEVFPIAVASGVILQGDPARQGVGVVITGSGEYASATFAKQNVTLVAAMTAQIRGVTVTNPVAKGTGIWVEGASPTIANCTFTRCQREGIFVTGKARPLVTNCSFSRNAANGISIVREAKGEYRQNTFQDTGLGLTIGDNAAPLLVDNQILENVSGILLSRSARPVLRGNTIAGNREVGIGISDMALPDLGSRQDPGRNILRDNGGADLRNSTSPPMQLLSVGNQLKLSQVVGPVELVADELPPPAPVTDRPPTPAPPPPAAVIMPPPAPTPVPPPAPPVSTPQASGLSDIRGHWAEGFIQALVSRGIISGFPDGTFRPEVPLTRVQYASMIAKTYDLPLVRIAIDFTDVPATFWGFGAIVRASEMGFLSGFPDKTFRPGANLTRIQAILGLVNGLQLRGGQPTTLQIYGDRAQIPAYAIDAVATATQRGMVVNQPNPRLLNPLRDVTRAEVSALLYQSLVSINRAAPIASEFIVMPQLSMLSFTDLDSHWSKDFILPLAAQDLIRGYGDGSFQPDGLINRVQFAAIVARAFNPPAQRAAMTFSDVPDNFWGKGVIDQAYRGGFLDRFPDASIRPASGLTRLELVQALVRGLGLPDDGAQRLKVLSDRASIPAAAQGQVSAAIGAGILVNFPKKAEFNPNQPATRADMTTMVYQAMARTSRVEPVSSAYIVK